MKRAAIASGALVAALLLSHPVAAQPQPYRALGTEPFWSLTIANRRMLFERAGERPVSVPAPPALIRGNGRRYLTRTLRVEIVRAAPASEGCSDGMSDRRFTEHVRVVFGGRTFRGCGGALLPPATLADTSWRIVDIAGTDVSRLEGYSMSFEADRMTGRAGCNNFSGPYRVGSDGFQAGPLAMTRMACPGGRMGHEQAVTRMLMGRVRLFYPDSQTLLMRSPAGTIRLRRQN